MRDLWHHFSLRPMLLGLRSAVLLILSALGLKDMMKIGENSVARS